MFGYYVTFGDEVLGTYPNLKEALTAMEEFTTVGGYDMVVVEKVEL